MPPPRSSRVPALLLVLAALLWAGNFVLGRAVHAHVPPIALAFWRWVVALVILLPLTWRELRAAAPILRRSWPILVPLGVLGVGNFNTLVYVGLGATTATNAVLLNSACPAFILAIGPVFGVRRATGRQLAGIAVSLSGVLAIVARGDPGTLLHLSFNRGDLWVLGAVLSWAFYTVLLARRPAGVGPLALLTTLVAVGVAWIAPLFAWELARGARLALDGVTLATIAYVAVIASVVAYFCWNQGVATVGATRAGPFLHLMPAFGAVLAALILGEAFRWFQLVGIGLILAGVALAGAGPARTTAPRRATP